MQYQHLVFEEFARKVQPKIHPFVVPDDFDTTINPSIIAEFAHVVYRFGHSMLTETIDRFDPNFNARPHRPDRRLPQSARVRRCTTAITDGVAAGAIIRGMTRQVGNEIDEFVTGALRNNLLGLPLDLPTINLARGRDTGVPSLNAARRDFYRGDQRRSRTEALRELGRLRQLPQARRSIINFIAAYGTHALINGETTLEGQARCQPRDHHRRRSAVFGAPGADDDSMIAAPDDAVDFLNSTPVHAWASNAAGVDQHRPRHRRPVDRRPGREEPAFGGLLGSTFNFVFENQMESLQDGDRFYYLPRSKACTSSARSRTIRSPT